MSKQQQLSLIGLMDEPKDAPVERVRMCKDFYAALRLCIDLDRSRRSQAAIGAMLGYKPGTWSQILNQSGKRRRHFDANCIGDLERICGNHAVSQWVCMEARGELSTAQQRVRELQRQLAEAQAELGAA